MICHQLTSGTHIALRDSEVRKDLQASAKEAKFQFADRS
jgi:hypothetical protein